jgi:hypothetical protein
MSDDLFPAEAGDDLPPALRRALAKQNAAVVVAAFELCALLSTIFRPPDDAAGTDTIGGAARLLLGVEFDNASRRYFALLAGLRDDAPLVPCGLLPRKEALEKARLIWAQHLLRRLARLRKVLLAIIRRKGERNDR